MAELVDLENALSKVCKAAFCEDNLARGINETCRAIETTYENSARAVLCLLADDCDESEYKKLVTALCKTHGVALHTVEAKKSLAVYAGLCRFDKDGQPKKVRKCSSLVIKRWPKGEEANSNIVKQHFQLKN
jgi:small subunit ribosomal protein S12e